MKLFLRAQQGGKGQRETRCTSKKSMLRCEILEVSFKLDPERSGRPNKGVCPLRRSVV